MRITKSMMSGVALVALKQRNISLKQCELFPVIDCSSEVTVLLAQHVCKNVKISHDLSQ